MSSACIAAELTTAAGTARTIESLPALTWYFTVGYAVAGWAMANLENAVRAMNGDCGERAGTVAKAIASFVIGISACLYLLTETAYPPLFAYFAAAVGAFGGKKLMETILAAVNDAIPALLQRWSAKGGGNGK